MMDLILEDNIDYLCNQLKKITIKDLTINNLQSKIINRDLLGKGGIGEVIKLDGIALKITDICGETKDRNKKNQYEIDNCSILSENNPIIKIPKEDKEIIMTPNVIHEGLMGCFMNKLEKYSPHFITIKFIYFNPDIKKSYLGMEKGKTDFSNIISNKYDVYLYLFQISQALMVAQEKYKFTHYDLHPNNIIYVKTYENFRYTYYQNDESEEIILAPKFLVKIIDFGNSRAENDDLILNSRSDNIFLVTRGIYNPNYDFMSLLGHLNNPKYQNISDINKLYFQLLSEKERAELLSFFFKEQITTTYDLFIDKMLKKYYESWRPKFNNNIRYVDVENIVNVNNYLAKKLKIHSPYIRRTRQTTKFIELFPRNIISIKPVTAQDIKSTRQISKIIGPGIVYKGSKGYFYDPISEYNYSPTKSRRETCPYNHLYRHEIYINSQKAFEDGYKFKTICCKLDPIEYFNNNNDIGVAINGGFFDIGKIYETIGPYFQKNIDFKSDIPIPPLYQDYYVKVYIEDNLITFDKYNSDTNRHNTSYFVTAPILVWDNQIMINENNIGQVVDGVGIFQCICGGKDNKNKLIDPPFEHGTDCNGRPITDHGYPIYNCDKIRPGELSHGANSNPRSMIMFRENSNDIILTVFEGRMDRGDGLDFVEMAQYAKRRGAVYAFGLDGGRSSNIAWVEDGKLELNTLNPNKRVAYPSGNILVLIK